MKFYQPTSLFEVKEFLNKNQSFKLLAGGTDLVLEIKREDVSLEGLIDLGRVPELKGIYENGESIVLGSMVTFSDLIKSDLIKTRFPSLYTCAKTMGSPQIRNMATLGGNIINGASAADSIPCIMALDGQLVFESSQGKRVVSCETYFRDLSTEHLLKNEVLTQIILPKVKSYNGFYKLGKRNSLAIARINVAVAVIEEYGMIQKMAISLGAVGKVPFRAKLLEQKAIGLPVLGLFEDKFLHLIEEVVYENIKGRPTMPFKKEAIKGVFKIALTNALKKEEE